MAKDEELHRGDRVTWRSHGGEAEGTVGERITSETRIQGHTAEPSKDDPQYVVETDGGAQAAHKPSALRRKA